MMTTRTGIFAILFFALACLSAQGASVTARYDGVYGKKLQYTTDGGNDWNSTTAGTFKWNVVASDIDLPDKIRAFCVDLDQGLPRRTITFDVVNPVGAPDPGTSGTISAADAVNLCKLWTNYYSTSLSRTESAVFQAAVWEIVYDGDLDLKAGDFQAKQKSNGNFRQSWVQKAQEWLDSLAGLDCDPKMIVLSHHKYQDMLYHVVPLPAAAWTGMVLLTAVAVQQRRRRRARIG